MNCNFSSIIITFQAALDSLTRKNAISVINLDTPDSVCLGIINHNDESDDTDFAKAFGLMISRTQGYYVRLYMMSLNKVEVLSNKVLIFKNKYEQ